MNVLEQKNGIISAHPIFSSLTGAEITELSGQLDTIQFNEGDTIFSSGEKCRSMFLVISGIISVLKTDDYGNSREIAKIIQNDSLGEIDMITESPSSVTAIAETASVLVAFPPSGKTFLQYLQDSPGTGSKILYACISDIAKRTREANDLLKENSPHIQELRRQMYEDKLTNLFNKTFLEENVPLWIKTKKAPVCLMMIKPDNFKQVNDTMGHEAGDKLLVYLAELLPANIPAGSILVRYIGNEFALLLSGSEVEECTKTAEKIRDFYNRLDVSAYLNEEGFHLSVSIGIALFPFHAEDSSTLIEKAHQLPLLGRSRGGNQILFPENIPERSI